MQTGRSIFLLAGIGLVGCAVEGPEQAVTEDSIAAKNAICKAPVVDVDPRKSLYVTDDAILLNGGQDFSLLRTLNQLAAQSGDPNLTGLTLFQQWWDTQNISPGQGFASHCDDEITGGQPSINGFPHQCPRSEGQQAGASAAQHLASYIPIGLVNRFDLAPTSGENCGEYRIVYGKTSFGTRNLLIFEARLPNPRPGCGLQACREVQQLWANLTRIQSPAIRAQRLAEFYYNGISDFSPVVHIANYAGSGGAYSGTSGQIRSNQFMQGPWNLREFNLVQNQRTSPQLAFRAVTVKTNPFGVLFNGSLPGSTSPLAEVASRFQAHFLTQAKSLAIDDINLFGYSVPDEFNAGESQMFGSGPTDYLAQFNQDGGSSKFRTNLEAVAQEVGLSANDLVNRAMAQSCGGCHQESVGRNLGGSVGIWPSSLGFVHNSEFSSEQGPDGPRKVLSQAVTGTFLPHRELVMERFLSKTTCIDCADPVPVAEIQGRSGEEDGSVEAAETIGGSRGVH